MDTGRAKRILLRGLRLRCPDCGLGPLYRSLFRMNAHCDYQVLGAPATVTFDGTANGHPQRMLVLNEGKKEPLVFEYVAASAGPAAAQVAEYAGVYYSDELDTRYTVIVKEDKLVVRRRKFEDTTLTPKSPDEFAVANAGSIKFTRDSQKRVSGFELNAGRVRHLRFAKESR